VNTKRFIYRRCCNDPLSPPRKQHTITGTAGHPETFRLPMAINTHPAGRPGPVLLPRQSGDLSNQLPFVRGPQAVS
jgi:hypothetical protein